LLSLLFFIVCYSQNCNDLNYPKQYVVHKLKSTDVVVFDGRIDEPLWSEVPWTDKFVDIEGPTKPLPYYDTWAKMRWDDNYLYIACHLEEPQLWANLTVNNSIIFYDPDIEVFIDPDGSHFYYKELELNGRNLNWNLLLVRPYLNGGPPVCNFTVPGQCRQSAPEWGVPYWDISPWLPSGVFINGTINDPVVGTKYWSIEIGIPIQQYVRYNNYSTYPPPIGSYWRLDFSRVQHHIFVHTYPNGTKVYWKDNTKPDENWVWQPTYVNPPNMHLPETWGYIQFADSNVNGTKPIRDPQWPVRDALIQVFYAETLLEASGHPYTTDLRILVQSYGLPQYIANGLCAGVPVVEVSEDPKLFIVTVKKDSMVGHIRNDRYLWFDS
jgi:hypothetical protein